MKKTLLSIALIGSAFAASSQLLFSENFNGYATGSNMTSTLSTAAANQPVNAQGGWGAFGGTGSANISDTVLKLVSVGTDDNAVKLTGTNSTGSRNMFKTFDWASRTPRNNVLFTSFIFNTGIANASRNTFNFIIVNSEGQNLLALRYEKARNAIFPVIWSVGGALYSPEEAVLLDDHFYRGVIMFDQNTNEPFYEVWDAEDPAAAPLIFERGNAPTGADLALFTTPGQVRLSITPQSDATATTVSAEFLIDDIEIRGRACISYDEVAQADFSYADACLGGASTFLNPVLVNSASTGVFSTEASTLNLDPDFGTIDLATTTAGTYDVKFVTADPYDATTTPETQGACSDSVTVTITLANCVAGLNELSSANFTVYPNPANDVVTVSLADNARTGSIVLTSADGKVIETRNYSNSSVETFNVKSLTSGIYIFQVGNYTERVIVK